MNNSEGITGWKTLKQRLSFKGLGCCGATWGHTRTEAMTIQQQEENEEEQPIIMHGHGHGQANAEQAILFSNVGHVQVHSSPGPVVTASAAGMNLAMALAAERNLRDENVGTNRNGVGKIKTLMRLIEETDGVDLMKGGKRRETEGGDGGNEYDWMCCVCMERNKGAAFIPCGHAFCRVCSRELWVNRGTCPICNRSILEILDIF